MILNAPFPPDIRVEKEAKTLSRAGHDVFIMAAQKGNAPHEESMNGYFVIRFDINKYRRLKKITRDISNILFCDPVWKKGIDDFVKTYNIDVLHVHDLPMVKTAHKIACKYNIPIVADYHENFPAHVKAVSSPNLSFKEQFYKSYKRWAKYEDSISKEVDRIIVVVDEYKNHLIEEHNVPGDKITVVSNTTDLTILENSHVEEFPADKKFIISYIGSFGYHRGLDVVIRGMPEILSHIPEAKFVVVGKGRNQAELEKLAEKLSVSASVEFIAWKDYSEIQSDFRNANVGVIPHHASEHTDNTVPNKLFEYMYFKVTVMVSDRPTLKRFIEETKAGKTFKTNDPSDFAKKVIDIYNEPGLYGEYGHKAVKEKYNWKIDGQRLIEVYQSFKLK
ncbi:MAG: glycosyltransferase family 4 protein [Bacteroidales bacterium]|nr:glycosyltransferase family 4 protein [Bacteroidales bacterium]